MSLNSLFLQFVLVLGISSIEQNICSAVKLLHARASRFYPCTYIYVSLFCYLVYSCGLSKQIKITVSHDAIIQSKIGIDPFKKYKESAGTHPKLG